MAQFTNPGVNIRHGGVRLLYDLKENVIDGLILKKSEQRRGWHSGRKL